MMADLQERNTRENSSAAAERGASHEESRPAAKKKNKQGKGCGFFIILLMLAAGVAAGLQASGSVDLRPYVYPIVPKIPYIGEQLAKLLAIPEIYAMTADERRSIELDEWETRITRTTRSMDERENSLNVLSVDLTAREKTIEEQEREIVSRLEALSRDLLERNQDTATAGGSSGSESADEIIRTFQDMSPRNAAAILEKLDDKLAVSILDGLPQDTRGILLGKMDADIAARLTEQLNQLQVKKPRTQK